MKTAKMRTICAAFFVFGLLACMLGCSDRSSQAQKTSAAEQEKIQEQVLSASCKTTPDFHSRAAIKAIEFKFDLEDGFAIYDDGSKLELPKIGRAVIASEAGIDVAATCERLSFLLLGSFGVIKMFESIGNPLPGEIVVFVRIKEREVAADSVLQNVSYLEQLSESCIKSSERGDASSPYKVDVWCADASGKPRRISKVALIDTKDRNSFWYTCNRSSGIGQISEKLNVINRDYFTDIPATISLQMDQACETWANESNDY